MKIWLVVILMILEPPLLLHAQISRGGSPMMTKAFRSGIPAFRLDSVQIHNSILESLTSEETVYGKKPITVAVDQKVNLDPENSGKWIRFSGGYKIWQLEVYSSGAEGLAVFFEQFRLNPEVMLFLYDPSMESVLGGFNHLTNKESGKLQTAFLPGEVLILELQVPAGTDYGELKIGSISHAFADIFANNRKKDGYYGLSGSCEEDINCPAGIAWQRVKRSVCRIIFKRDAFNTDLCTGTLINNTSEDGRPFFYTANHCIKTEFEAETAVFYFGYESEECKGEDGQTLMTLSGSTVLASSDSLDFSLLLLSESPPESYFPYFSGWSLTNQPPSSAVSIHHPRGDVKKISRDFDPPVTIYQEESPPSWLSYSTPGGFWRIVQWEVGATEPGSSGAPLFNPSQLIIGNLTGGDARCYYPENDYYSKFFMNWDYYPDPGRQLKHWLDPGQKTVQFMEGYDPYNFLQPEIFTIYPNPGPGIFTIHSDTLFTGLVNLRLYNINGSLLGNYSSYDIGDLSFDFSDLQTGVYFIEIITEGYHEQKKIVILR